MRASAVALVYVFVNLLGSGLGPALTGWLSDHFSAKLYGGGSAYAQCARLHTDVCRVSSYLGLRQSLMIITLFLLWAAFHYIRAGYLLRAQAPEPR
jgi:hypothetical protein